ncbi:MAG: penicillin-binding transpeptidase domain-containing protein [Clostridia bacterium]|nr:penicillin-binding transpeptidase domain-containing protein [Clostridia bacterium]
MKQLQKNIRKIALFLCALFVLLAVWGAYSISTYGSRWFASPANTFARAQKKDVIAGNILDRSGVVLASTVNGQRVYQADLSARKAAVHAVGDSSYNVNNSAESFFATYLYGFRMSYLERLSFALRGEQRRGDNVQLTIDSRLAAYIASVFPDGKSGAVVVMNYKTGEVLSEQSFPNFDPQNITSAVRGDSQKPFFNRAVQGLYTPGSTFKIVTAASVMENMPNFADLNFSCTGTLQAGQRVITDAGTDLAAGALVKHGDISLKRAFQVSCNNVFARIALQLGDAKLRKTAESFGFNENFLFRDLVVENSSYPTENRSDGEIAWTGAGQSALSVSPMHMCMIASSVANHGVMMEPRMLLAATAVNGTVRASFSPRIFRKAMTEEQAAQLKDYMRAVVTSGTGTAAQISGKKVCGKTGSAEMDTQEFTNAWFTGFLDEETSPYAISIVVENAGGGGSVAAPIARKIFTWMLENGYQ